ncbi:hypothetical protein MBUL_04460 (plasmid) [Methylobacterium bullatum]|uniref:Uncharacterized protein n=1 Tax=Methylobacterium bullatum TaxID=570505 RepID=A0A679JNQ2_9HYPH|nr:hypothetical protein MBUL_04460 [Methylobacterium bullatum]
MLLAPDMLDLAGPMLARAQEEYGQILWTADWALMGVLFHGDNPSVRQVPGMNRVAVVLPMSGADDTDIATAFLAHEVIHCMYLAGECTPPMIEEGAAVRFSLIEAAAVSPDFAELLREHQTTGPEVAHYAEALVAVEWLLKLAPEAIRTLRAKNPDWKAITPERIKAVAPQVPAALASVLCEVREMRPDYEREMFLAEEARQ